MRWVLTDLISVGCQPLMINQDSGKQTQNKEKERKKKKTSQNFQTFEVSQHEKDLL